MDPHSRDAAAHRARALAKIRKLLALAEDQADRPEGAAARERAMAMMATYGLERGDLDLGTQGFGNRRVQLSKAEAWRRSLVHTIADYFDCVALFDPATDEVETYGPAHMLPQVEYTYHVYLRHLVTSWREHVATLQEDKTWDRHGRKRQLELRDAFCRSFVFGVHERLEAKRAEEERDDPASWALMLESRRDLGRWMRQKGVRWRPGAGEQQAFLAEGYQAGKDLEVHRGVSRHQRRELR